MPHATMPPTEFQAVILCGPGESLSPFNANPKDFPKALIPIANRPMVWYALDWCHRMGISDITLVIPPESAAALESALALDPYLTSLPAPKPSVLAPPELSLTTGTAEIFRLREVQDAITSDFVVLPCDLVSDLSGSALLETWLTTQGGLGSAAGGSGTGIDSFGTRLGVGGEKSGRRGGLGVWYQTKDDVPEGGVGVKKEETDFLATTDFTDSPVAAPAGSLRARVRNVVMTMPTDTLKDIMDEQGALNVRHRLLRRHGRVRMQTTYRDAHVYLLPYWAKEYMRRNDTFESVGEDVLGWWAKAGWQDGLAAKLQLGEALRRKRRKSEPANTQDETAVDIASLSSTTTTHQSVQQHGQTRADARPESSRLPSFASRVGATSPPENVAVGTPGGNVTVPPLLAYVHPAPTPLVTDDPKDAKNKQKQSNNKPSAAPAVSKQAHVPLIRRTDTVPLLLSVSLHIARLPATSAGPSDTATGSSQQPSPSTPASTLAHVHKVHPTSPLPPQSTIDQRSCLVDANCALAPRITLRECVIGPSVRIAAGARLTRCVVMEGASVDERAVLTGCVVGRRARVGKGAELRDCFVSDGYAVGDNATGRGEVLAGFDEGAGLGEDDDAFGDDDYDGDGDADALETGGPGEDDVALEASAAS